MYWTKASVLDQLKELILLEEFKNCVPDRGVYLNEQKVTSLAEVATLADELALTRRTVFTPLCYPEKSILIPPRLLGRLLCLPRLWKNESVSIAMK